MCLQIGKLRRTTKKNVFLNADFKPGVDVIITISRDFRQFSAKKLAFFSITKVMIIFSLNYIALFWVKNDNLFADFSKNI
jgi:hypothetical protein